MRSMIAASAGPPLKRDVHGVGSRLRRRCCKWIIVIAIDSRPLLATCSRSGAAFLRTVAVTNVAGGPFRPFCLVAPRGAVPLAPAIHLRTAAALRHATNFG